MSRCRLSLPLSATEAETLQQLRDHHPKPYMRERAAALIRISAGEAAFRVAITGILRPRTPNTVYAWLHAYKESGIAGLQIKPRRRRKIPP